MRGLGNARENVTLMVQVPASFNPAKACIVTGTSSGSRGVYGAIGSSGEWGLKRGCAVAYADKGTGMGVHDLLDDTVNLIDGTRTTADLAGSDSQLHGEHHGAAAPGLQREHAESARGEARALASRTRRRTGAATRCGRSSSRSTC